MKPGVSELVDVKPLILYSTVKLEKGSSGEVSLFTVPQGQHMPTLRAPLITPPPCPTCGLSNVVQVPPDVLTKEQTNLCKAGELGSAIGDVRIKRVRILLSQTMRLVAAFTLRISGQKQLEGPVTGFQDWFDLKEEMFVSRYDCFEGRLLVLERTPVESDVYVRVEFDGLTMTDVR